MKIYKLAVLTSHPIQYQAPLFKKLAQHPHIDLMVYFCCDYGIKEKKELGFGVSFKWDIPLLEGYKHKFLKNYSPFLSQNKIYRLFNPDILVELRRNHYDAVWVNGYTTITNWLVFLGAKLSDTALLFRGESDLFKPRSSFKGIVKRIILIPLFNKIDAFLCSYKANEDYYRHYNVPENKLFFCPCATDNEFWQKKYYEIKNKKCEIKKNLRISNNYRVILFVGKLIPRKHAMDLLKAFEMLSNQDIKLALMFVGSGIEEDNLKKYVHKNRLQNVYFVGFKNQSKIATFYSIADVLVLPSEYDPSPKVVNEAMNFHLPIIITDRVGTGPDLIKNGENGFIYPIGDVKALVSCLSNVLEEPQVTQKMGARSFELVSNWNFDEDVKGIVKALNFVVGKRKIRE